MLFERRLREGLTDGTVTVAFRRWRRPQVVAGHTYRTGLGPLVIAEAVDVVDTADLTVADARDAGFGSVADLLANLRGDDTLPLYRIRFRPTTDPDPRDVLRGETHLDDAARAALDARLARLDRAAGPDGAWTATVLRLLAAHPGTSAGELAAVAGMEKLLFKRRVRSLKELGLTISLATGYRLSPRAECYLSPPSAPSS